MSEPFGSGDCRERVDGARCQCGNKNHSRFRAQGFGDHGGDAYVTRRTKVPNCGRPRQAIVKKGLTVPSSRGY
jgi:hypothetical protein